VGRVLRENCGWAGNASGPERAKELRKHTHRHTSHEGGRAEPEGPACDSLSQRIEDKALRL
jgi:hypothetical protein